MDMADPQPAHPCMSCARGRVGGVTLTGGRGRGGEGEREGKKAATEATPAGAR
jgi:hypothetical protein